MSHRRGRKWWSKVRWIVLPVNLHFATDLCLPTPWSFPLSEEIAIVWKLAVRMASGESAFLKYQCFVNKSILKPAFPLLIASPKHTHGSISLHINLTQSETCNVTWLTARAVPPAVQSRTWSVEQVLRYLGPWQLLSLCQEGHGLIIFPSYSSFSSPY